MDQALFRDALASAYAAGVLDPAFHLLLETQAAVQPRAKVDLVVAEAVAGALLDRQAPAPMSTGALDRLFAQIDALGSPEASHQRAAQAAGSLIEEILSLPNPIQDHALEAIGQGEWAFAGPGLRVLKLDMSSACRVEILRIEPGWGAPRHSHNGSEFTLVMKGAFSDARGRYAAGDIAFAGPELTHQPIAEKGEICYALAVSEGDMAFTGALGLVQRIWRH
jgi:putative transcriptional regulator